MPIKSSHSIIIVGAGPVGLCCALALAEAGHSVTIVDSGMRGAGWASGGMLGAVYETLERAEIPDALTDMAFEGLALWGDLTKCLGVQTVANTVFVARTPAEVDFLKTLAANAKAAITPVDLPLGCVGLTAWACADDLALDPRATLRALRAACAAVKVAFVQGVVTACASHQVTLSDCTVLRADTIILATGQGGDGLRASVPELSTISPVKGQLLALAINMERGIPMSHVPEVAALVSRTPSVIRAGRIYLIPRGNHTVIGATSNPSDLDPAHIDKDAQIALHQEAVALCPALKDAPIVESWAGLRPMTPDGLPLVGQSSVDGVLLACGTYRNGWLLAPALAKATVEVVRRKGDSYCKLQSFSPLRFPI